ncbi:hypothetical protein [Candidatus Neptunochlamydia vexilliferae]|uniref:Uncharacterized protein n=1 Tax=Candidatus Neptunichlamydia vexilliferae TaxID=1651774 RepID=A0ABS0AYM0_9BACT|nr:hypothetical protein [Candidatus Neptunochlamydia vexilliferae]MBF5059221.1 hypothetical protein [Candidatus Neptunochlamydia vexilliferae]
MIYRLAFLVFISLGMALFGQEDIYLNPEQHVLRGKGWTGIIAFEDGTCFKTLPDDAERVYEEWEHGDTLVLIPNTAYFGGSEYYIENCTKDELVHVDFHAAPDKSDEYTWTIFHIDPYYGEIVISRAGGEKQEWKVEEKDLSLIQEWEKGDRITIGKNDVWYRQFVTNCRYIMLNCDKNETGYIRIKLGESL